jgi:protein-disulfide isomerase
VSAPGSRVGSSSFDLLFNQTGGTSATTPSDAYAIADRQVGAEAFDACYRAPATADAVDQDRAAGLRAGIDSTPSFLINGVPFLGAQPYAEFQTAINAALAAAS